MGRAATSNGPRRRPASLKPAKYPVSPAKYSRFSRPTMAHDAQRRRLASQKERCEKCWAGTQMNRTPPCSRSCHQSRSPPWLAPPPPVELLDVGHPIVGDPRLQAERDDEERVVGGGQPLHGRQVEMIVVIVRDHDHVDAGQRLTGEGGRAGP